MNEPTLVSEIVEFAVSIAKSETTGKAQQDATVADSLVQIVEKSAAAEQQQAGEPLDPDLIQPEEPI